MMVTLLYGTQLKQNKQDQMTVLSEQFYTNPPWILPSFRPQELVLTSTAVGKGWKESSKIE